MRRGRQSWLAYTKVSTPPRRKLWVKGLSCIMTWPGTEPTTSWLKSNALTTKPGLSAKYHEMIHFKSFHGLQLTFQHRSLQKIIICQAKQIHQVKKTLYLFFAQKTRGQKTGVTSELWTRVLVEIVQFIQRQTWFTEVQTHIPYKHN